MRTYIRLQPGISRGGLVLPKLVDHAELSYPQFLIGIVSIPFYH
jgi:hypothetical protein